ncbi:hypothetical protein C1645_822097 [Glomus cerebriforme]|uniref:Uncharacterized protein n=1 Tax=Glomus cerebriforme TaxID=658196 RepID=A0A397SYW7_9GLOM|nr:hypothetical protein C1645_822097 [Glomus cerebriforme]
MPHKTKRKLQISKIPRKKGCYVSRDQEKIETKAVKGEKWMDNENINEWTEDWTKEDLKEFEKVGKKLITEVLCWHEKATDSIRIAYNGTLRTTV